MAISFEQMPEANRQRALEIFGQQMRGEITRAQAEQLARQNEAAAQAAISGGGGSASGTGRTPPFESNQGKPGETGDEAVCGPRPTTTLQPGQVLVCNRQTRQWEVITDPAQSRTNVTPTDPMTDPTRKPSGAPEGFDYVWNGSGPGLRHRTRCLPW